jgi:hypothetical protein
LRPCPEASRLTGGSENLVFGALLSTYWPWNETSNPNPEGHYIWNLTLIKNTADFFFNKKIKFKSIISHFIGTLKGPSCLKIILIMWS